MEPSGWRRKELICMILHAMAMEWQYDAHKIQWQRSGQKLSLFCNYLNQCSRKFQYVLAWNLPHAYLEDPHPLFSDRLLRQKFLYVLILFARELFFVRSRWYRFMTKETLMPLQTLTHHPKSPGWKKKNNFGFFRPFCVFFFPNWFSVKAKFFTWCAKKWI